MEHLAERIDPARWSLTSILGAIWGYVVPLYIHVAAVVPLYWLALLWCVDMFLGVWQALRVGGWRALSLQRMEDGIAKLARYTILMILASWLQEAHMPGAPFIVGVITVHVLLKVFGSAVVTLGKIFSDPGIENLGRFAEGRADGTCLACGRHLTILLPKGEL